MRGTFSRRDNMWNDDWVGLSLDSVGNGQSSYDLFINPQGVQADVLTTPSAGENSAPDFVWESAGRRTAEGYDVEVRLPLTSFRFKSGAEVRMGILFWRRVSRLGVSVSWPDVPAGKSFIERHALMTLQRPEAAAHARADPERDLVAPPDARRSERLRGRRLAARRRHLGQVRRHLGGHGRGHLQPRLQPGRERRVPGRGEPALPGLLLGEAPVLHGGHGHLRAGGGGRRLQHAHRRQHARDRGPALGRQVDRDGGQGELRAARGGRRSARDAGGGGASRTRSSAIARSTSSAAASGAWAAAATRARS